MDPFDDSEDWLGLDDDTSEEMLVTWLVPHPEGIRGCLMTILIHQKFFEWLKWNDRGKQTVLWSAGDGNKSFAEWWACVKGVRSQEQWRVKMVSFGVARGYMNKIVTWDCLGEVVMAVAMLMGGLRVRNGTGLQQRMDPHFGVPDWQ